MPIYGNIIIHAFQAPYMGLCLIPWLILIVLAIESSALWLWNRHASIGAVVGCVGVMNLVSYLAGFIFSPLLLIDSGLIIAEPDEDGYRFPLYGPRWQMLARLAFLQAWAVSTLIEMLVLLAVRQYSGIRRVIAPVIIGNSLSYALLFAGFVAVFGRMGMPED